MAPSSTVHRETGTSPQPQTSTDKRNAELALEISSLRLKLAQSDIRDSHTQLTSTVERQAAEIEALTRMLEAHPVAKYVAGLERERASLEDHVAELEFRLQRMLASSSWRLTRPVRAAAGLVSKVLRRR